uniref:Sorting nexin 13 n=1 Tax=Cyprinus carpio TaxID=7962 RepID=A0A8C2D461_CYPCA
MLASLSVWGWGGLGVVLFLITFGPFAIFYLAFYILCFIGGGFVVLLLFGKINSEKHLERCEHSYLPSTQSAILKVLEEMKSESKPIKIDRRLTGSSIIDEPLQQVIQFALRDYIQYWYYTLSDDETFLLEIRQTVQNALVEFSTRSKEVDWQPYFTTRLVDDFATHLRVFRKAQERLNEREDPKQRDAPEELLDSFFEAEVEMERKICRDVVCMSRKDEEGFLRDLCEVLLYLLLPPGDFHNKNMRYLLKEVLARGVLLPLINQLSDPDYINQFVIWMIRDSSCNYEAFLNILKLTDKVAELEAVKDKVLEELQYLRSLDTGGDDINFIKNQINSLLFVKKVCETRIQRLQSGKEVDTLKLAANFGKLCVIPLEHIIAHNIALQFFMDYMQHMGGQAILFFWLTVEGYRVTAQQQLEVLQNSQRDGKIQSSQTTKGLLRSAALGVYDQYLSEKASPRVEVDEASVTRLAQKLNKEDPTPEIFDEIQKKVYDMMLRDERFYPSFKQHPLYVRMLAELDMLKEPSYMGSDHGDGESFNGSPTGSINLSLDDLSSGSVDESVQLHFETLGPILKLPGKKTFNNMDREFLEKRKKDLNSYLQLLLNPEMVKACPMLMPHVYDFLENKAYSKGKGDFARKMDTFVNPLRSSMRNVSNAVKSLPDSLAEGVSKVSADMGRMSEKLGQDIKHSIFKVPPLIAKSDIDPEHCRISAQLDDNVSQHQIKNLAKSLEHILFIKKKRKQCKDPNLLNAMRILFVHKENKNNDFIQQFLSLRTAQNCQNGDTLIWRDTEENELKHIIGAETTRKGILRVFDMFQHQPLNRRLACVFLEGYLETLFPQYKFPELFVKLHSRSPRVLRYSQKLRSLHKR